MMLGVEAEAVGMTRNNMVMVGLVLIGVSVSLGCSGSDDEATDVTEAAIATVSSLGDMTTGDALDTLDAARELLGPAATQDAVDRLGDRLLPYFQAWADRSEAERAGACESADAAAQLAEAMTTDDLSDQSTMEDVIAYQCAH
jgi:hypothetical protein